MRRLCVRLEEFLCLRFGLWWYIHSHCSVGSPLLSATKSSKLRLSSLRPIQQTSITVNCIRFLPFVIVDLVQSTLKCQIRCYNSRYAVDYCTLMHFLDRVYFSAAQTRELHGRLHDAVHRGDVGLHAVPSIQSNYKQKNSVHFARHLHHSTWSTVSRIQ